MNDYDRNNQRMSGAFRAGEPARGIQSVQATVGRKPDEADRVFGTRRKQIDQDIDDFTVAVAGGARDAQAHPFQVFLQDRSASAPKARVISNSRIYTSISTTSASITGLNTDIALASNTHIWLEVTVSSLAATARSIQNGTSWPTLVVISSGNQTQFNVPIGKVTSTSPSAPGFEFLLSGTAYHFEQCLFSHLIVQNRCSSGTPIIYALPFGGAV